MRWRSRGWIWRKRRGGLSRVVLSHRRRRRRVLDSPTSKEEGGGGGFVIFPLFFPLAHFVFLLWGEKGGKWWRSGPFFNVLSNEQILFSVGRVFQFSFSFFFIIINNIVDYSLLHVGIEWVLLLFIGKMLCEVVNGRKRGCCYNGRLGKT